MIQPMVELYAVFLNKTQNYRAKQHTQPRPSIVFLIKKTQNIYIFMYSAQLQHNIQPTVEHLSSDESNEPSQNSTTGCTTSIFRHAPKKRTHRKHRDIRHIILV